MYAVPDFKGIKFTYTLIDQRDKSLTTINVQDISHFKLSRIDGNIIEIKPNRNLTETAQYGIGLWEMTKPFSEPQSVNGEQFQKILKTIASVTSVGENIDEHPNNLALHPPN